MPNLPTRISRRHAFAVTGGAVGLAAASQLASAAVPQPAPASPRDPRIIPVQYSDPQGQSGLPVEQIKNILTGESHVNNSGVLEIMFGRSDLGQITGPQNVPFDPGFQIGTAFFFQGLGQDRAITNGAIAVRPHEANPVIRRLLTNGLVFQAFHQHFFELHPMLYFIHYRGIGDPVGLAHALRDVLQATGTPLNQQKQGQPSAPFDVQRLESILGGEATVSSRGVVTVSVKRRNRIYLGGVDINPTLNVMSKIAFEPVPQSFGRNMAAGSPDFSMTSDEIDNVMAVMEQQGWLVTCLYNQETDENPQLFYSHQLKVGDPIQLAQEMRRGLDRTNSEGSPRLYSRY